LLACCSSIQRSTKVKSDSTCNFAFIDSFDYFFAQLQLLQSIDGPKGGKSLLHDEPAEQDLKVVRSCFSMLENSM
jgi:hypothetical protein